MWTQRFDPAWCRFSHLNELSPGPGSAVFEDSAHDRFSRNDSGDEVGFARDATDAFAAVGDVVYVELDERTLRWSSHGGNGIARQARRETGPLV
jgi:hypothetical protein